MDQPWFTMRDGAAFNELSLDTIAIHAGQPPDASSGAVMTPIVLSSTFAQESPGVHKGYEYSRSGNPTRRALEACLAALEGGSHGFAFASGLAATTTLAHTLKTGDHILAGDDLYGGTFRLFDKVMGPMGVQSSFIDMSDPAAVRAAIRPSTRMIWIETPTNPLLKVYDIAAVAEIARAAGVPFIVDNTFATPILQRPLELGATAVMHSTTKYLNGHSDVVGGAIVTSDPALAERLTFLQNAIGAVPSPFDSYLVLRGLKTLAVRMRQACASAAAIADRLERHPKVARVHYPGLASHRARTLAERQMRLPGAMISFDIKGDIAASRAFLERLQIFACAESLGGVESLAELPAIMTHASIPETTRAALGISNGFVRLSIGIEGTSDLWADIERSLAEVPG